MDLQFYLESLKGNIVVNVRMILKCMLNKYNYCTRV